MFNPLNCNVMKKEMYFAPESEVFTIQTEQIICQSIPDEQSGD